MFSASFSNLYQALVHRVGQAKDDCELKRASMALLWKGNSKPSRNDVCHIQAIVSSYSLFFSRDVGGWVKLLEDLSWGKKLVWWALHSQQLDGGKDKSDLKRKARRLMSSVNWGYREEAEQRTRDLVGEREVRKEKDARRVRDQGKESKMLGSLFTRTSLTVHWTPAKRLGSTKVF